MTDIEEWLPTKFYGYEVSSLGRVRATIPRQGGRASINGGLLRGYEQQVRRGYKRYVVTLRVNGKNIYKKVAHLVLEAFVCDRPPGLLSLHGNGNPLDNRLRNLRWGTPKENMLDAKLHGTAKAPPLHIGESHPNAKLTSEEVKIIRETNYTRGKQVAIAKEYGVSVNTIRRIRKGAQRAQG